MRVRNYGARARMCDDVIPYIYIYALYTYTYIADVPPLPPKTAADVIIIVISVLPSIGRGIFYRAKDAPAVRGTTRYNNILYL